MRRALLFGTLLLALVAPSVAQAFHDTAATPQPLHSVHQAVTRTWYWQDRLGVHHAGYFYVADQRAHAADRPRIARTWWDRAHAAYVAYRDRPVNTVPAWFVAAMPCLAHNEEYGAPGDPKGGYNTTAGYFGMISPPYAYPGGYGSSWLAVSYSAQIPIVYQTWLASGSGAWPNTAPGCGL